MLELLFELVEVALALAQLFRDLGALGLVGGNLISEGGDLGVLLTDGLLDSLILALEIIGLLFVLLGLLLGLHEFLLEFLDLLFEANDLAHLLLKLGEFHLAHRVSSRRGLHCSGPEGKRHCVKNA